MTTPSEVKRPARHFSLAAALGACLTVEQAIVQSAKKRGEPVLPRRVHPPRNAPCPCQSGKKYKHCHGRHE